MRLSLPALRVAWAGLLSLLLPGLGQVFAGRRQAALRFTGVWMVLSLALAGVQLASGTDTITSAGVWTVFALVVATVALNITAACHAALAARQPPGARLRRWWWSAWTWGAALLAANLAFALLPAGPDWQAFSVPSASMLPTLRVGDRFAALTSGRVRAALRPGDVIVFHLPRDPSVDYVKRLVAVGGQTVQMRAGRLTIDGHEVPRQDLGPAGPGVERWRLTLPDGRSYVVWKRLAGGPLDNTPPVTVAPGSLFVLGDNLDDSLDSRVPSEVGQVPRALVIGRAAVIVWSPFWRRIGTQVR